MYRSSWITGVGILLDSIEFPSTIWLNLKRTKTKQLIQNDELQTSHV